MRDLRLPKDEYREVQDSDNQQDVYVWILPSNSRCLTASKLVIICIVCFQCGDIYFQTKLKRINPPTPRYEPIQSTFPPLSAASVCGTRKATVEKTIAPSSALYLRLGLMKENAVASEIVDIQEDEEPLPLAKLDEQ